MSGIGSSASSLEHDHAPQPASPVSGAQNTTRVRGRPGFGRRLGIAAVLLAIYFVLEVVAKACVLLQFCWVAACGQPSPALTRGGDALARNMFSMWRFLTFVSDRPPWPFGRWPDGDPPRGTVSQGPGDDDIAVRP